MTTDQYPLEIYRRFQSYLLGGAVITATHSGEFMGVPATGRTVTYDAVDMFRVKDSRIVWRFLICDWKSVTGQLTAA